MAKKTTADPRIDEIKKSIEEKKAVIGRDMTIKRLKRGEISKVYLSSNCADNVKQEIDDYCRIAGIESVQINYLNDEFAVLCKKPFSISVLGIKQ